MWYQSHDSRCSPVPRRRLGALPSLLCEGESYVHTSQLCLWFTITTFVVWKENQHVCLYVQFVFKTEPYTSSTNRTVHEELAKAMTAILKPSTDFLTSNKLLKVTPLYFLFFMNSLVVIRTDMSFIFIDVWLMFAHPAVLLVLLWGLSQVHGSVPDWKL